MKVIFLDIDGVLNNAKSTELCYGNVGIDDDKAARLGAIVEATGAEIVLSSSWKHDWEPQDKELQNKHGDYIDQKLKKHLLSAVDKTYESNSERRGEGIIKWVGAHEVDSFIILDDEWFDFKELGLASRVIKTEFYGAHGGLTNDHVARAIELLNCEIPN